MAKIVEEVVISADATKAKREASAFEKKLTNAFVKGGIAVSAYNKILDKSIESLKNSFAAALEYHDTNLKMSAALKAQGEQIGINVKAFNAMSNAMEEQTGISDEIIRGLQTQAIAMGVSLGRVDDFTRAAIALNTALGVELNSAMRNLVKTTGGLSGELGELLPAVGAMTKEQRRAGEAIEFVNREFGEFIDAHGEGPAGQIRKATAQWESLTEQIALSVIELNKFAGTGTRTFLQDLTNDLIVARSEYVNLFGAFQIFLGTDLLGIANKRKDITALADAIREIDNNAAQLARKQLEMRGGKEDDGIIVKDQDIVKAMALERRLRRIHELQQGIARIPIAEPFTPAGKVGMSVRLPGIPGAGIDDPGRPPARGVADIGQQAENAKERGKEAMRELQSVSTMAFHQIGSAGTGAFSQILDAIEQAASGGEIHAQKLASSLLKGVGRTMIGHGIANILQASARIAAKEGVATPGEAELLKIGGLQVAGGTVLFGGGLLLTPGGTAGGGAGAGESAGGGSTAGFNDRSRDNRGGSQGGVTIIFNGPTTAAEVGLAIEKARGAARSEGLI